jgi:hypothetical protein
MQLSSPDSETIRTAITTRSQNFLDVIVPFDELGCEINEDNSEVNFKYNLGIAQFSTHAFGQLLTRVQLSIHYWKRLYNWNARQLMIDNFNFCNEATANEISNQKRNNDPNYLFRLNPSVTLDPTENDDNDDDEDEYDDEEPSINTPVRAVLSSSYSVFDDDELFPMLMDQLDEDENVSYVLYEYDNHITRLHIRYKDTQITHEGLAYSAGMVVTNSEVGSSSIWIEPVVYRGDTVYANRSSLTQQDVEIKIVHRGDIDRERVNSMFITCAEISQVGIVQLVEAFQTKINPNHALSLMRNIPEFPNRMSQILFEDWEHEEDLKHADVAHAILEMAQELPLFQRAKVEQAAGRIVGLFNNYSSRMTQIIEDIDD